FMTVWEAIEQAERILPGQAAPEEELDPRWQAIIEIGEFIEEEPDAVWSFITRWGCNGDEDLRAAVATCLLEHLLEYYFERFFPKVEEAAQANLLFAHTFLMCSKFGQSEEPGNSRRFNRLRRQCRKIGL
ncbi:MAG: hypothetical protein ACRD88_21050, partial [Terriglobia bacterium]